MPTLRGFFRAVAPRFIGIRSSNVSGSTPGRSGRTNASNPKGRPGEDVNLKTFGSAAHHIPGRFSRYNNMDDDDDDTFGTQIRGKRDLESMHPQEEDVKRLDTDDGSEKGIIQTQSITVAYTDRAGESAKPSVFRS